MHLPYDESGSGSALVLLHAGIADRTMWTEHLQPLADFGHRVIAPDLPGFGAAPVAAGGRAPWTDVLDLLDGLGIDQAAFVGNSFGAAVALRLAAVAPARASALVLISAAAPTIEPSAELEEIWQAEESALERGDLDAAVAAVVRAWTLPDARPELRDRIAAMQRRAYEQQLSTADTGADNTDATEAPDPVEDDPAVLSRLTMPALVAAGEFDLPDFRAGAQELGRLLPRGRAAVIPGAGHLAPLETPELFRNLVLNFLS
jgi:pimeloyl-ACP methyl ester carboxylesterase